MLARVKKLYKNWKADRQQLRELTILLENLTDYTFLARATAEPFQMPMYNAIYKDQR
jgi:hypothetical protein